MKSLRHILNLTMLMTFIVMVVSGCLAFFLPFSIKITGLHALMGFLFLWMIIIHLRNNITGLKRSNRPKELLSAILLTSVITAIFIWQPRPVMAILNLSSNQGASIKDFKQDANTGNYLYNATENYQLKLEIKYGKHYKHATPPSIAIWLENGSGYHVQTLFEPDSDDVLPYWRWKVIEYEKAKLEAQTNLPNEVDALSSATPNASFDPLDYILPERNTEPFYLVLEVDQAADANEDYNDQPSILYRVEIDNAYPSYFQILDILGYTKYDDSENQWDAYYPDGRQTTALSLIDSALLTIKRSQ